MKLSSSIANEEANKLYCKTSNDIIPNKKNTKPLDFPQIRGNVRATPRTRGFARHPTILPQIKITPKRQKRLQHLKFKI
jgi:hypothetical protein